MAAKIGILGETVAVTASTITTFYTVPADKAARIRLLFCAENTGTDLNYGFSIGMPGVEYNTGVSSNVDVWGGIAYSTQILSRDVAYNTVDLGASLVSAGVDRGSLVPLPGDFFLSTGDTIKVTVAGGITLADHIAQAQGVEDDA